MGKIKTCKKCGSPLAKNQKYCPVCGRKLKPHPFMNFFFSFIIIFIISAIAFVIKYSNDPTCYIIDSNGTHVIKDEYSIWVFRNSFYLSVVCATAYSIFRSKNWKAHKKINVNTIDQNFRIPPRKNPVPESEESAYDLIAEAKFLADQINNSTSVNMFSKYMDDLFCTIDKLIWMNEIKKVKMINPPREQKKRIERNMEATINDLITRCIDSLPSPVEKRPGQVDAIITDINRSGIIQKYMTDNIRNRLNDIRSDAYKGHYSLNREKTVKKPENALLFAGIKNGMDYSSFDSMDVISALEKNFDREYKQFCKDGKSLRNGEAILKRIKESCSSSSFPLAAEVRLESLIPYYESKFLFGKLLVDVDTMSGLDFENWCANILELNGFSDVSVTAASGDQGVDVLAEKSGVKYAIQCKCYSSDLGNTPVQEVHAGKTFYNCHVGVVMTNRHFTPGAKELAAATGVLLWDRDKLQEFISTSN